MEVYFFTEYHCSTEHDYGNIAKGCEEESTIKDDTHRRRGHNIHTVVSVTAEDFSGMMEDFLSRDTTKQRVIPMINDELREREWHVVNEQVW